MAVGSRSVIERLYAAKGFSATVAYTPGEYHDQEVPMAIEKDPVCGMEVDTTTSLLSYEHDGTTYWFCGKGCLLEFKDDPDRYLDPEYEPSM
jgi:YHS domain-containing protein